MADPVSRHGRTAMDDPARRRGARSRRPTEPWPWLLAGLLVLMISASLAFFAIASANPDPLVVDDVWEAGQRYNDALADQRRARSLGVDLVLEAAASGDGGVRVAVVLAPPHTAPASVRSVHVRRERPAEGGLDGDFALSLSGDGTRWEGHVPLPRPGRWELTATALVGETPVRKRLDWWQPARRPR